MLFVDLILATPKLWVKLESFVSAYIIHLETCLNGGRRLPVSNGTSGINLVSSLPSVICKILHSC